MTASRTEACHFKSEAGVQNLEFSHMDCRCEWACNSVALNGQDGEVVCELCRERAVQIHLVQRPVHLQHFGAIANFSFRLRKTSSITLCLKSCCCEGSDSMGLGRGPLLGSPLMQVAASCMV